jgi:hypothetical protein
MTIWSAAAFAFPLTKVNVGAIQADGACGGRRVAAVRIACVPSTIPMYAVATLRTHEVPGGLLFRKYALVLSFLHLLVRRSGKFLPAHFGKA